MAKKSTSNIIIGLLVLGGWYIIRQGRSSVENLRFYLKGIKGLSLRNITTFLTSFSLIMQVENPTATPIAISGLFGEVIFNKYAIAKFNIKESIYIAGMETINVEIPVQLINANILANIPTLIAQGIKAVFTVKTVIQLPFSQFQIPDQTVSIA